MKEEAKTYGQELIEKFFRWFNNENFMEDEFKGNFPLLKRELNVLKVCLNGELPGAKFEEGEFVYDCKYTKVKSDDEIVQISSRSYTENRGWVYSINYLRIDKENLKVKDGGGGSCWWDEKDFEKIDDPLIKLIIKKYNLEKELRSKKLKRTESKKK